MNKIRDDRGRFISKIPKPLTNSLVGRTLCSYYIGRIPTPLVKGRGGPSRGTIIEPIIAPTFEEEIENIEEQVEENLLPKPTSS